MTDSGPISSILGINIKYDPGEQMYLDQMVYIGKMMERFLGDGMKRIKGAVPLNPLDSGVGKEEGEPVDQTEYRALVGSLLYLAGTTRPDIQYATGLVARYSSDPRVGHQALAEKILNYVGKTKDLKLIFQPEKGQLVGYADAGFAQDQDDRKSTTGYSNMLGRATVSWYSGKQKTVSTSTSTAEYIALGAAIREGVFLHQLLTELGESPGKITLHEDNQAAIAMTKNPVYHSRQKHVDIQHHYIREEVNNGRFEIKYIPTKSQLADIFTKPLPRVRHQEIVAQLGLKSIGSHNRGEN